MVGNNDLKVSASSETSPVYGTQGSWFGLKRAVNLFNKCPDEIGQVPAEWNLPVQPIVLADSISTDLSYHLLLTEDEFKNLRKFADKLASYDVD